MAKFPIEIPIEYSMYVTSFVSGPRRLGRRGLRSRCLAIGIFNVLWEFRYPGGTAFTVFFFSAFFISELEVPPLSISPGAPVSYRATKILAEIL